METEKQSLELLTQPDPLDHYAELLRIRQRGTKRELIFLGGITCICFAIGLVSDLNTGEFALLFGICTLMIVLGVRRSEYAARDEILKLLEVLRRTERGA